MAEEKPSGHFVPESPKNSTSARCQSKGWGHPLHPLSLERVNAWATQQRKETVRSRWTARWSASGEPRAHLGWEPSEAASLPTREKGQASRFPPRPFSCVMTPDCLQ